MGNSILFEIQEEVNLVAEAIKSVLSLEVIIYDKNKVVVTATGGGTHAVVGEPVRGHIIAEVLKTNQPVYNRLKSGEKKTTLEQNKKWWSTNKRKNLL